MQSIWGIDLGGTKIEGVVLTPVDGGFRELARERIPTQSERGYDHIIQRIGELIKKLEENNGPQTQNKLAWVRPVRLTPSLPCTKMPIQLP